MIDRTRNGDELREVFKVLGSTGNVSVAASWLSVAATVAHTYVYAGVHCRYRQEALVRL